MKKIFVVAVALLAVSCASDYSPELRYVEIRVSNNSDQPIQNLTIQDQNSQRMLECGDLTGFGYCQLPMPKPRYQGLPLDVSWVTSDGEQKSQAVELASKGPYTMGVPVQLELHFAEDGSLSGVVEQQTLGIK